MTNGKRDYKKEKAWEERNGNKRVKDRIDIDDIADALDDNPRNNQKT